MKYIRPSDEILEEPFWRGARDGHLMLQRCTSCGRVRYPPSPVCAHCHSFASEWVPASGGGTLYSFTVVHHPVHPAIAEWVPYAVGLIQLSEGVRIVSLLRHVDLAALRVGLRLKCVIEPIAPGFTLPCFMPITDKSPA